MTGTLNNSRNLGYTMLELVMTMAIVAILATIAVPGFQFVTNSNRIATEVNGLLGDLQFARSQAVKEGESVTVCTSSDGTNCSGSPNWQSGWIVFLDTNGDKTRQTTEAIVKTQAAFNGTDTFVANPTTFTSATYNRLGYGPTGSGTVLISLHDSTSNTNWTRCLVVNPIGSAVTEKYGVGTPPCT